MSVRIYISVQVTEVDDRPQGILTDVSNRADHGLPATKALEAKPRLTTHVYDATLPRADAGHATTWLAGVLEPGSMVEPFAPQPMKQAGRLPDGPDPRTA